MSKKTIVAAIRGQNNKKVNGSVANFSAESEKKVVVEFTPNNGPQQTVDFGDLYFANHKVESSAQTLRTEAIAKYKNTNGTNAQESLMAKEVAAYAPAD
jgi:hypothetical protein